MNAPADASDVRPESDSAAHLDRRISTREALRVIGVHRATVLRWIKQGKFPPKHPSGGWRRSDLERWLARGPT